MARVLQNLDCRVALINSVEDHVHLLFDLGRTVSVSGGEGEDVVIEGNGRAGFAWQAGYGAFGVSESQISAVRECVANQQEHHRKKTFQEEYRAFMERHGLGFDERYGWG